MKCILTTINIHKNPLNPRVAIKDLESLTQCLLGRSSADVEKVSALPTVQTNQIIGRHSETGPIDYISDIAVQSNIRQAKLGSLILDLFLGGPFFKTEEFLLSESSSVVKTEFSVEANEFPIVSANEGVKFKKRGVFLSEELDHLVEDVVDDDHLFIRETSLVDGVRESTTAMEKEEFELLIGEPKPKEKVSNA